MRPMPPTTFVTQPAFGLTRRSQVSQPSLTWTIDTSRPSSVPIRVSPTNGSGAHISVQRRLVLALRELHMIGTLRIVDTSFIALPM